MLSPVSAESLFGPLFGGVVALIVQFLDVPSLLCAAQISLFWHHVVTADDEERWKPRVPHLPFFRTFAVHKLNYLQVQYELSPSPHLRRLVREYKTSRTQADPRVSWAPAGDSVRHWVGQIAVHEESPYYHAGAPLLLDIRLSPDYPFKPPKLVFLSKVYHPNVGQSGEICMEVLHSSWAPAFTICAILLSVEALLRDPNLDDPLEKEIARVYRIDRGLYEETAKEWRRREERL